MEALGSIRVLDLSHLGPGMLATMMLGDFGAEVISICSEIQDKKHRRRLEKTFGASQSR